MTGFSQFWLFILAAAQVASAQVTGIVRDSAGAVVPGATVTLTDVDRGISRTTVATAAGVYTVAGVPPGWYRVACVMPGFRTPTLEDLRLETGAAVCLDIELVPGDIREAITVT